VHVSKIKNADTLASIIRIKANALTKQKANVHCDLTLDNRWVAGVLDLMKSAGLFVVFGLDHFRVIGNSNSASPCFNVGISSSVSAADNRYFQRLSSLLEPSNTLVTSMNLPYSS